MHRCSIILLAITVSIPARAIAQRELPVQFSPASNVAADSSYLPRFRGAPITPSSPAVASTRGHRVRIGAAIGAAVGAIAGVVGSTFLAVGCAREPCHGTKTRIGLAVWLGSLGALGGGIVGATVGAILPTTSDHQ